MTIRTEQEIRAAVSVTKKRPVRIEEEAALVDADAGCDEYAHGAILALADCLSELASLKSDRRQQRIEAFMAARVAQHGSLFSLSASMAGARALAEKFADAMEEADATEKEEER